MASQRDDEPLGQSQAERDYLAALERNVASGRPLAGGKFGGRQAGGRGASNEAAYMPGAILSLGDGAVGVYRGTAAGKEHQIVYFLEPDGRLVAQGVMLRGYGEIQQIGSLPTDFFQEMIEAKRWNRDAVVFHLNDWKSVRALPPAASYDASQAPSIGGISPRCGSRGSLPGPSGEYQMVVGPEPSPPKPAPTPGGLRSGQRFSVKFGDRDWDAVYWGRDDQGTLVVHCTNKKWAMMHLDLARFGEGIAPGAMLSADEIKEIKSQVGSE